MIIRIIFRTLVIKDFEQNKNIFVFTRPLPLNKFKPFPNRMPFDTALVDVFVSSSRITIEKLKKQSGKYV